MNDRFLGEQLPLGGITMRQHLNDEKVHYKLYKDGNNWVTASIATGIAIPVALFSAAILSPMQGVQATSNDSGYVFAGQHQSRGEATFAAGFANGTLYDATEKTSSTVTMEPALVTAAEKAGMRITIKDDQWQIGPKGNANKVNFDQVLAGISFPTTAQLDDPTAPSNISAILTFMRSNGLLTVNGGNATPTYNGIKNGLISGSGVIMPATTRLTTNEATIGTTGYNAIISGPLSKMGADWGTVTTNTLVADGGTIQGSGAIPNSLVDSLSKFHFTDGSMANEMRALKAAVVKIDAYLATKATAQSVQTADPEDGGGMLLDFTKADRDDAGDYVFTVDSNKLNASANRFRFANTQAYAGGNVILVVKGGAKVDFTGQGFAGRINFIKNGGFFIAAPGGNTFNLQDADNIGQAGETFLAPTSDISRTTNGAFGGLIGSFNGATDNDPGDDASGNGYEKPDDGSDNLDTPTTTTKTQAITKTIHFQDADGNTLAPDYTTQTNVTETLAADGTVIDQPVAELKHPDTLPTKDDYKATTTPAEATSDTPVKYGDANIEKTVVYTSTAVTRTIHIQDDFGHTLAPDIIVKGNKSFLGNDLTFDSVTQPTFKGYSSAPTFWKGSVATKVNPFTATHGPATSEEYTVKYAKNPVAFSVSRTVTAKFGDGVEGDTTKLPKPHTDTKTLYVDENGKISAKPNGDAIALGDPFGELTSANAPAIDSYTDADGTTFTYTGTYDNEGLDNKTITDDTKT